MTDPFLDRPNQPNLPPDVAREPLQVDPVLNEGRAGKLRITAAVIGAAIVVVLVLYGLTRPVSEDTASAPPPAATTSETTGRANPPQSQQAQPQPQQAQPQPPQAGNN